MDSPGAQTPFALCTQEISTRLECMCMCATLNGLVDQEHAPPLPPHTPTLIMVPQGGLSLHHHSARPFPAAFLRR